MTKIPPANTSKLASTLRSILILSSLMLVTGCWTYSEPPPMQHRTYQERPANPPPISESCMTEAQCEQSKKEYLISCEKESASILESCRIRNQAAYKSCCEKAGYSPNFVAEYGCSSCSQFRWGKNCDKHPCNWTANCKTADNIVPPNDRDALDKCCETQGAKERARCDKEMANEYECDRIEKIAVNACIGKSPASKASAYTESAPKPLQPSAQPNGGSGGMAPSAAPQSSEY